MSRLRRAFTSGANVVVLGSGAGGDVQGLTSSGHKVHAIEQDEKQSQAMMANFAPTSLHLSSGSSSPTRNSGA